MFVCGAGMRGLSLLLLVLQLRLSGGGDPLLPGPSPLLPGRDPLLPGPSPSPLLPAPSPSPLLPGRDPLLQLPYDLLYTSGLREYHRAEWRRAVPLLERSLLGHSALRRLRTRCRERCGRETPVGGDPRDPLAPLRFFGGLLSRADCLRRCLSPSLGAPSRHRVTAELRSAFHSRTAYNYLQLSYYKLNQLDKAAAAAQTFITANPDHLEMLDNLEKYRNMEGMKAEYFKDLEAQPHWEAYEDGTRLYQSEHFPESIPRLEDTLREYMTALAECQAQCEGPYNFRDYSYLEYQSHLYEAISDHYVQVLGCNQGCMREVATKPGRVAAAAIDDFLPSLFSYLQYAYHKVGNYEKAVECSRTFLLFHPEDRSVHQNLAFYESKFTANRAAEILPREDIKWYLEKSLLEKEMLYYTMDTLGIPFNDPDSWTPAELIPQSIQEKLKAEREAAQKNSSEIKNVQEEVTAMGTENEGDIGLLKASSPLFANLKVAMNSNQLNGSQRVVLDGVLTHKECAAIRSLANAAADSRDGSRVGRSPHTPNERFEGLTILKALKLARDGVVDRDGVRLYYKVSERTRTIVENYFRSKTPLYFSFSHLVCRSALTDQQENRDDLSHPVHADNCLLDPEAMACWKEPPADTARDYSAVLYLNDEFEGGEFFFTEPDAKTVSAQILPKCGRLVTFTSGGENPHGVRGVTGGQRCAVALWFTLDHRHSEKERVRAEALMEQLFPSPPSSAGQEGAQPHAPPLTPVPPRVSRAPEGQPQGEGSGKQKKRKKKTSKAAAPGSPRKDEL